MQLIVFLTLLNALLVTEATKTGATKLIQDICDTLYSNQELQSGDDQKWETICQDLFGTKENYENNRQLRQSDTELEVSDGKDLPNDSKRAAIRIGSGIRTGGGTRTGGGSRTPPVTRYRVTRTGTSISQPQGWQWSRTRLVFLPLATRFAHRSRSSSNRYTTPAGNTNNYYYCTSTADPTVEIQCSGVTGDTQCCEEEATREAFCCGGEIPSDILQDMNRATQLLARLFYALAAIALSLHFLMRRA